MTAKTKFDRATPLEDFVPRDSNGRKLRAGTETQPDRNGETTEAMNDVPMESGKRDWPPAPDETSVHTAHTPSNGNDEPTGTATGAPIESGERDLSPVLDETGVRTTPIPSGASTASSARTSPGRSTRTAKATSAAPIQPDDLDTATSPVRSGETTGATTGATTDARTAPGTPRRSTTSIVDEVAGETDGDAVPNGNSQATGRTAPDENGETAGVSAHTSPDATDEVSLHISPTQQRDSSETPAPTANNANSADVRTNADTDPTRRTVKQRKSDLDEYRRRYMQTPRIEDRKPVFVSRRTRDRLDRIVRLLGERGMSVSGLIENIAIHHLDTHEADVEYWRKM